MPRRPLTHEEFLNKFYEKNEHAQDIEILGTYINNKTKIRCRCKIDGYEWSVRPADLLRGRGCPKCGEKRTAQKQAKTHEQFIKELHKISPDIEILGTYINTYTKIKCRCKIDGYEWEALPQNLLSGSGCPKCAIKIVTQKNTKTYEQFMEELQQINKDIEVLGTYVNATTKILCKCKVDEYEWKMTPNHLLHGYGCPKCGGNLKLTHKEFITKVKQVNPNIEVLCTYVNSRTKIKCKCAVCEHEWEALPQNLLNGSGCPKCSTSKGEKRIAQYLDKLGIDYIYDKRYFKDLVSACGSLLRPDFIIPSLKIWIEYDGIQHFKPTDFTGKMSEQQLHEQFKIVQQNDQIKDQYAKDNNWTLIRIPFTEYDNIEQILAAYLKQEQAV